MADEQVPKRVVKRVVKKPVAPTPQAPTPPKMRYGRPVSGPGATKVAARDKSAPAPPTTPNHPKRPTVKTPNIDVKPVLDSFRSRTSSATSTIGAQAGRAGRATGRFTAACWAALRAWRIPRLEPVRASLIAGLIAGLVAAGLGAGSLRLFAETRGVASGGGAWGSLAFVVITVAALVLGERLLTAFGSPMPRLTSFLGILLTIILILSAFLELADSRYGLIVVPVLSALAFFTAYWLLHLADSSPAEVE